MGLLNKIQNSNIEVNSENEKIKNKMNEIEKYIFNVNGTYILCLNLTVRSSNNKALTNIQEFKDIVQEFITWEYENEFNLKGEMKNYGMKIEVNTEEHKNALVKVAIFYNIINYISKAAKIYEPISFEDYKEKFNEAVKFGKKAKKDTIVRNWYHQGISVDEIENEYDKEVYEEFLNQQKERKRRNQKNSNEKRKSKNQYQLITDETEEALIQELMEKFKLNKKATMMKAIQLALGLNIETYTNKEELNSKDELNRSKFVYEIHHLEEVIRYYSDVLNDITKDVNSGIDVIPEEFERLIYQMNKAYDETLSFIQNNKNMIKTNNFDNDVINSFKKIFRTNPKNITQLILKKKEVTELQVLNKKIKDELETFLGTPL